jgi:protein-tyrosine-phosphatase
MARAMFADRAPGYRAVGAGTLVLEGQPMSQRTRLALAHFDLSDMNHRSRQFGDEHAKSDLVVAMEPGSDATTQKLRPVPQPFRGWYATFLPRGP